MSDPVPLTGLAAERTLALAALVQAARVAHELAAHGRSPEGAETPLREALFIFDAPSVEAIFGEARRLLPGLKGLLRTLEGHPPERFSLGYAVHLLMLAERLLQDGRAFESLGAALEASRPQALESGSAAASQAVSQDLARIYQQHISPVGPRLMIQGEPVWLNNGDIAARIRAALLGGIRAAVLWRQLGGGRWEFIWHRGRYLATTKAWIQRLEPAAPPTPGNEDEDDDDWR